MSNSNTLNILRPFGNTFTTNGGRSQGQATSHSPMTTAIDAWTVGWPVSAQIRAGVGAGRHPEHVDQLLHPAPFHRRADQPGVAVIRPGAPTFRGTLRAAAAAGSAIRRSRVFGYEFNPAVSFDLDYRYLGTTNQTLTKTALQDIRPRTAS